MMFRFRCCELRDSIHRCRQPPAGRRTGKKIMRWETPKAIDFRFGMEITMYIANR